MITPEVTSIWAKMANNAANPLNINESLLEKSIKQSPPRKFGEAIHLGRYVVPRTFVNYNRETQSRDKEVDQNAVHQIHNVYRGNGVKLDRPVPVTAFDPENPHLLEGLVGYHRNLVFENMQQEIYFYDVYDFSRMPDGEYVKEVVRNITNHHGDAFTVQTKHDDVKSTSNAIARGLIPKDYDAISKHVDIISADKSDAVRKWIVKEVAAGETVYPNFRTYSSQRGSGVKNSLQRELEKQNLPKAGIENRTREQIEEQGFITYCAVSGDNQSTWARAITNSTKFGVPVIIIGYSDHRVEDLSAFRQEWVEEFISQKELMYAFSSKVMQDQNVEIDEFNFPIKIGGFLPQYTKPNPEDKGAPTEHTIVDQLGNPIDIHAEMTCLSV